MPECRVRPVTETTKSRITKSENSERVANATPRDQMARLTFRDGHRCGGGNASVSAKNAAGRKLALAKVMRAQNVGNWPEWLADTPAAQHAISRVKVVNRRLISRSGDDFQTKTANPTRSAGTARRVS